jgi:hypothetical protein
MKTKWGFSAVRIFPIVIIGFACKSAHQPGVVAGRWLCGQTRLVSFPDFYSKVNIETAWF